MSRMQLRIKLSLMMFLEYAAWGAWMPILSGTLANRHVPPQMTGFIYAALWAACIFTPSIGGQIVDRWMASQKYLGLSHLLAAGAAFMMAFQTTPGGLLLWMSVWALLFAPTLGITNSVAFHHIEKSGGDEASREREFSWIRTAGTVGWIVAGGILTLYMMNTHGDKTAATGAIPEMVLCGMMGILMVLSCFMLPNTPPAKEARQDPLAIREALALFKSVPGFAVFMAISFIAATEFQFFYVLSAPYLETLKIPHMYIPVVKSISQVMEVAALSLLLPLWLPARGSRTWLFSKVPAGLRQLLIALLSPKGMRWCLLVGSFAWPLRYVIFALGQPIWLVVASLGLHGFGYAFVLVVQQLYVDRVAPKDIRGSAQSLLTLVTLGVGNTLGSIFCGYVQQYYTVGGVTQWVPVFVLPAVTTTVCAIAYMLTFRNLEDQKAPTGKAAKTTAG